MNAWPSGSRTIASILWRGGALGATLIAALMLSPHEFGRLATGMAASSIVSQFAAFGLVQSVTRGLSLRRQELRLTGSQSKVFAVQIALVCFLYVGANFVLELHPIILLHGIAISFANVQFAIRIFGSNQQKNLLFSASIGATFFALVGLIGVLGLEMAFAVQSVLVIVLVGLYASFSGTRRNRAVIKSADAEGDFRCAARESWNFGLANVLTLPLLMLVVLVTTHVEGEVRGGEFSLANTTRNVACFYALQMAAVLPAMIGVDPQDAARKLRREKIVSISIAIGLSLMLGGFYAIHGKLTMANWLLVMIASALQAMCVGDGVRLMLEKTPRDALLVNALWACVLCLALGSIFLATRMLYAEIAIVLAYASLYLTQRSILSSR